MDVYCKMDQITKSYISSRINYNYSFMKVQLYVLSFYMKAHFPALVACH